MPVVGAVIRTRTLLAALVATALLMPMASAQTTPLTGTLPASSIMLSIQPSDPIGEDLVPIKVHGTYSAPLAVSLNMIELHFEIDSAPAWLLASFSPSTVSIPLTGTQQPGLVTTVPFTTTILVATVDAPADAIGELTVSAWTYGGGTVGPGGTTESTVVQATGGEDECHHAIVATADEGAAADADTSAEPTVVETQSASVAPVTGPVVGALSLLGAAGGGAYVLRRKSP